MHIAAAEVIPTGSRSQRSVAWRAAMTAARERAAAALHTNPTAALEWCRVRVTVIGVETCRRPKARLTQAIAPTSQPSRWQGRPRGDG
ncbi:hypothetical protein KNE206_53070 [Kitasatospora sp. NE20-6]